MQNVRIGFIGAGNRGRGLARALRSLSGAKVTAICDLNPEILQGWGDEFNIPANNRFTNVDQLLAADACDAVMVTTPDHTHYEIVMAATRNGKHVFCEKPMALEYAHCRDMQRSAEANGVILMLGFCLRYNNLYRKAKELIAAGQIGKVRMVVAVDSVERGSAYFFHGWHRLRRNSGGLLLQKAVHSLDIINWLVDSDPVSVTALGSLDVFGGDQPNDKCCAECADKSTCPEFIDTVRGYSDYLKDNVIRRTDKCVFAKEIDILDNEAMLIHYANGAKVSFTECHFTPDYQREFTFIGDRGKLEIVDFYCRNGVGAPRHHLRISQRHTLTVTDLTVQLGEGGHGGGDQQMLIDFIEVLQGKRSQVLANGRTGVISTALAEAAEKSVISGQTEPVPR